MRNVQLRTFISILAVHVMSTIVLILFNIDIINAAFGVTL